MRVIVLFDLPVGTSSERREYSRFRKSLVSNGFYMLQESVYVKLTLNTTAANAVISNVKKNKPPAGLVQMLCVTEKQFSKMELIVGEKSTDVIDCDERIIVI